ncbi:MAG TPA: NADH-quinone oxidoreductase subunit NuoH [Anaerolineae bacterium]|nr:NADH-quinone oxidoreductase subunit NuoH [Anaerolineae bacterium]HOQ98385.1 NADH-quinone oxidoreductase subunit NuoH [Anaerolineae bacterium]HPL26503.1 NADH-quinone oxidoreductase subunit NuoH [Anaerolineae bacterium]
MSIDWIQLLIDAIKALVIAFGLLIGFAYLTWFDRRLIGRFQMRLGPNRVGPFGLLQPIADALKMFFKEDIVPAQADKVLYFLGPAITMSAVLISFAVVPMGPEFTLFGRKITLYLADVNVGMLVVMAVLGMGVYGMLLGGWGSNNKYSLMGGLRSAAQVISYELPYGLSLLGVFMLAGSLSMAKIVEAQARLPFIVLQPLGALVFLIAALAEMSRTPFDLVEAENELVGGYNTEYSSIKFALYYMGEYIAVIVAASIFVTIFLGGWQGPFLPGIWWFFAKLIAMIYVLTWIRVTLPRIRYDRLMSFAWKVLVPLAVGNVLVTALGLALRDLHVFGL